MGFVPRGTAAGSLTSSAITTKRVSWHLNDVVMATSEATSVAISTRQCGALLRASKIHHWSSRYTPNQALIHGRRQRHPDVAGYPVA
jgi:hypothetical protein